jgi:glycosidase
MALVDLQNITVSSQSPTFQYSPARDGPINTGWNVTYTGNNDSAYALQTLGRGETSHRTSLLGAYVELDWTGTAVYVYGSAASNSSYQLAVDGIPFPAVADLTQGFLGSILGLTYGEHTLRVTTQDSQLFSVQGATLTIGVLHGGWDLPLSGNPIQH